jgi:hypothetical protein
VKTPQYYVPLHCLSHYSNPSKPRSTKMSPSFRFPHQSSVLSLPPIRATCLAHLNVLDFMHRTSLGAKHRSLTLHHPVFSTLLLRVPSYAQISFLCTLFSNTLSVCSSFNLKDGDSRPHKTWHYTEHSVNPTRSFWFLLSIRHTFLAVLIHRLHTL